MRDFESASGCRAHRSKFSIGAHAATELMTTIHVSMTNGTLRSRCETAGFARNLAPSLYSWMVQNSNNATNTAPQITNGTTAHSIGRILRWVATNTQTANTGA